MRNYFGGLHQFPTNIAGQYRVAVIGDVVLSGPVHRVAQLDYFLSTASRRGVTDALYLGPALSVIEAASWPHSSLTTWCLHPPPQSGYRSQSGNGLRSAPPGFVLARPGYMMPVFLHRYSHPAPNVDRHQADAAVHLIGGLPHPGSKELSNGGYEISIGTFPFAAAIVELELGDRGELECRVVYWQLDNLQPSEWL